MALFGCQAAHVPMAPTPAAWVAEQGGTQEGPALERVQRAAVDLDAARPRSLRIHVLDSDVMTAYAWPSGEIYLTRRLIDALNDRELAAAIAHEVGHLINAGYMEGSTRPASLSGSQREEGAADESGRTLLARAGLPTDAMASMLTTVSHAVGCDTLKGRSLARRALRLRKNAPTGPPSELSPTGARGINSSIRAGSCAQCARPRLRSTP